MTEKEILKYAKDGEKLCRGADIVDENLYREFGVKRGLRDINGHGVLTGVTNISKIISSEIIDGQEIACDGQRFWI